MCKLQEMLLLLALTTHFQSIEGSNPLRKKDLINETLVYPLKSKFAIHRF